MSGARPIETLLVANRGEIACRIFRTARRMGIRTVAVYSDADAGALHTDLADEAVHIGPAPATQSYLDPARILDAARQAGADAIHPGYGFLSENADFADAVRQAGLIFVGPGAEAIRIMGDKGRARRRMLAAGVPCVPGYDGADQDDAALGRAAEGIGYPLMIKAAAGGGGRGMRLVTTSGHFAEALAVARSEAAAGFGSDHVILEKAVQDPRHVEFQIFADRHGTCLHLGERDCSVQRRFQKVIEEAPCPVMTDDLRVRMGAAAIAAARDVGYVGAGTVEFLLGADGAYYFLEMNTRLQVEHPVTEAVAGVDLVEWQIAVAAGAPLPLAQDDLHLAGHAIEARLYAEDPAAGFLPATGRVHLWRPARGAGIRVDAGIRTGETVSPHYDPMLAKILAHGDTREDARARLIRALEQTALIGPATNAAFLLDVLRNRDFASGAATTGLLTREWPDGPDAVLPDASQVALAAAWLMQADRDRALALAGRVAADQIGWSSAAPLPIPLRLSVGATEWAVSVLADGRDWIVSVGDRAYRIDPGVVVQIDGRRVRADMAAAGQDAVGLSMDGRAWIFTRARSVSDHQAGAVGRVLAPMPGRVIDVPAAANQQVVAGQPLMVIEAMKMQHPVTAPVAGTVAGIHVSAGDQVAQGDLVAVITDGSAQAERMDKDDAAST